MSMKYHTFFLPKYSLSQTLGLIVIDGLRFGLPQPSNGNTPATNYKTSDQLPPTNNGHTDVQLTNPRNYFLCLPIPPFPLIIIFCSSQHCHHPKFVLYHPFFFLCYLSSPQHRRHPIYLRLDSASLIFFTSWILEVCRCLKQLSLATCMTKELCLFSSSIS